MKEESKKIFLEFVKGKEGRKVKRLLLAKFEFVGDIKGFKFDMTQEEIQKVQDSLKVKCETIVAYIGEEPKTDEEIEKMYYPHHE
ncbi:MAG: hypothetical protein SOY60_06840 [Fusobacterium gastrosuis]|uniref:hypothetical protein n=1 Tax=Fusobacterium gastrosuis TaxID=1755100 RepID=UPI002A855BD3|nr:hypothetical protein [Fusobacterium gastrosuis]MDY5795484.1 hypothetical protein [Fusobacterium gastrosuis]